MITAPVDGKDAVLSFDFTGKEQWRTTIAPGREGKHRNGSSSYPSSVTDGKRVFTYYESGNVASLDIKGKLLLQINLQDRFGKDTLYWDIGSSPVLTIKYVTIAVMHQGEPHLVAFDQATGEIERKVARNYETPTEGDHSYATPILIKHGDKEAIVVWGAEPVAAHDAADGKTIWSCAGFNPQKTANWIAVASHLIVGDLVSILRHRHNPLKQKASARSIFALIHRVTRGMGRTQPGRWSKLTRLLAMREKLRSMAVRRL